MDQIDGPALRRNRVAHFPLRSLLRWPFAARGFSISARRTDIDAESILNNSGWQSPELLARAEHAIAAMLSSRIGGACWRSDEIADLPRSDFHLISARDAAPAFESLWEKAVDTVENMRDGLGVVCDLPETWTRARSDAIARGWVVLTGEKNPWPLLDRARRVFAFGGETGFLALLRGLEVHCLAPAFYAARGLTKDGENVAPALRPRNIREIFAAECLLATRYFDPFGSGETDLECTLSQLAEWRRINEQNRRITVCVGMSFWKRGTIAAFLRSTDAAPRFVKKTGAAIAHAQKTNGAIAVWNSREPEGLSARAKTAGIDIIRIEDGFLRSVGLGADFMPGVSIVADRSGIYYDPAHPGDLAHILENNKISESETLRARAIIQTLIRNGITKYNVGEALPALPAAPGQRRIFVPGQVEDDRSVQLGGRGMGNLELLRRVRMENPDAFILFKPHPDVDAGHRRGAIPESEARKFADAIVHGVSSAAIINAVDEVHTLTSLAGFEALLRERRVVTYGASFYAGWGLTDDMTAPPRRRRISLEQLAAAALIIYPRYLDPVTALFCTPELILKRFEDVSLWRPGPLVRLRRLQGALAKRLRALNLPRPLEWKPR
jgi:capsular polysaccharide export protein